MNELLAGVYGTSGFEKTASEGGLQTLSDIALLFASEAVEGGGQEKIASAHGEILEHLVSFDQAGRAIAQHEFTKMEKMAFAGDPSAIEAFFADVEEPQPDDDREAILAEIERRIG